MNLAAWLGLGTAFHALVWQCAEAKLQDWGEVALAFLTGKPANQITQTDAQGIPVQLYRKHGRQYNPLFVANQAKADFQRPQHRERFIQLTGWLLQEAELRDSALLLPYRFALPELGLEPPWHSCLAQATTLLCFAQRSTLEKRDFWLQKCRQLLHSLEPGNGLAICLPEGGTWFPEYPDTSKAYVLNGMLSIVLYLEECWRLTGLDQAQTLFQKGFAALVDKLPQFDCRGFSYYSLDGSKAGRNYHQMHVRLLRKLRRVQPHPVLDKFLRRWALYDWIPVAGQLFFYPRPKRVAAYIGSLFAVLALVWLLKAAVFQ